MKLEEYVFQLGSWKSLNELEDNVTLDELHRLFTAQQKAEHAQRSFAAALKGVEMDPFRDPDLEDVPTFDEVAERAAKRRAEFLGGKVDNSNSTGLESMFEIGEVD